MFQAVFIANSHDLAHGLSFFVKSAFLSQWWGVGGDISNIPPKSLPIMLVQYKNCAILRAEKKEACT